MKLLGAKDYSYQLKADVRPEEGAQDFVIQDARKRQVQGLFVSSCFYFPFLHARCSCIK